MPTQALPGLPRVAGVEPTKPKYPASHFLPLVDRYFRNERAIKGLGHPQRKNAASPANLASACTESLSHKINRYPMISCPAGNPRLRELKQGVVTCENLAITAATIAKNTESDENDDRPAIVDAALPEPRRRGAHHHRHHGQTPAPARPLRPDARSWTVPSQILRRPLESRVEGHLSPLPRRP